jgi:hypothetical protein
MTYYTITPPETLVPNEIYQGNLEMFNKAGIPFIGERLSNGAVKVSRIISTDPNDYMSGIITPGAVINNLE